MPFQRSQVLHCLSSSDALWSCTVFAPLVFVEAYYCPRGYYWIPRLEDAQIDSSDSDELDEAGKPRGEVCVRLQPSCGTAASAVDAMHRQGRLRSTNWN